VNIALPRVSWVQSYGSRYIRVPIIYGDVTRRDNKAMTTREFIVAQSKTNRPVKGMLTGPVTLLNWSFPRKDISRKAQAFQLGEAMRGEIVDLETAGCRLIQVDEPALREGLPLRVSNILVGVVVTIFVCRRKLPCVQRFRMYEILPKICRV